MPVYASLENLVAAGEPTKEGTRVTVSFSDKEIKKIYVTEKGYRNGIYLSASDKDIEIFFVDVPAEWEVGGKVSGKLTDCTWKNYNGTWELCPDENTWKWTELTYTAPTPGGDSDIVSGLIQFGTDLVKIDRSQVTATDNLNNSWTITTEGTDSFTLKPNYCQIGAARNPASSITFVGTIPDGKTVTSVSAKFGGFSSTTGNIAIKVGETEVGAGKLNAAADVDVKSEKSAAGNTITITITGIAKGVKVYQIGYSYK